MEILIFFVAHWYLSLFAQSFFHHRYSGLLGKEIKVEVDLHRENYKNGLII